MNITGNPETLVASHPGNTNAMKYGVHSPRLIEARAAQIVAQLTHSFEFSVTERIAVEQVARARRRCSSALLLVVQALRGLDPSDDEERAEPEGDDRDEEGDAGQLQVEWTPLFSPLAGSAQRWAWAHVVATGAASMPSRV